MIKKGKHLIKSHMTLEYNFTGIRIQESSLTPVDWKLTVDLVATIKKGVTKEDANYTAGIAYQKIYFWLETNLPNIAIVDVSNKNDLYIANLSTNITMYCPGNPGDDLLIQLLHAKICSLSGDNLLVGEIHLKGSDTSLHYIYDSPDTGCLLPDKTSDYYTESITRDTDPWWFRDDGFCFEFARPEDNELSDDELFKDIVDPMVEFYKIMAEVTDTHFELVREPAKIIQVEKWKPHKVE